MPAEKIAVSLPSDLLRVADRLARDQRKSRSRFIAELIARAAGEAKDKEVAARLDRVYGRPAVRREQLRMAHERFRGEIFGDDSEW